MGELTRDDVQRAVHDGLRDLKSEISRIHEEIQRLDRHTSVLDESQREMRGFAGGMQRMLDQLFRRTQQGSIMTQEMTRLHSELADVRLRMANIEQGIQQIVAYLQTLGSTDQGEQQYQRPRGH